MASTRRPSPAAKACDEQGIDWLQFRDPWWRICNLYTIVLDDGTQARFVPNEEQRQFYENLHYRNLIAKARQLGMTTFVALLLLDQCIFNQHFTGGIIAHTKDDAAKIFRNKVVKVYEALPQLVRDFSPIANQTAEQLVFANGSSITVSSSVRSSTVQFLHVSEMGKIARKYPEKAREIVTGSFGAVPKTGIIVVESTSEGKSGWWFDAVNEAQRAAQQGSKLTELDFKLHFFPWYTKAAYCIDDHDSVVISDRWRDYFDTLEMQLGIKLSRAQRAWYVRTEATLGDDMKREYPATVDESFAASMEGFIYGREMAALRLLGKVGNVPFRAGAAVNTFWDLGVNDQNAIWLHQRVGATNRFIRYFEGRNEGMRHYYEMLEQWRRTPNATWGKHNLPHDADQRIQGFEVTTRRQVLEELGMRNIEVVPRVPNLMDGIEAVRRLLPECEFDAAGCVDGLKCLDNYTREWDEHSGTWSSRPRHDHFSNGADAFRQFAQAWRPDTGAGAPRSVAHTWTSAGY